MRHRVEAGGAEWVACLAERGAIGRQFSGAWRTPTRSTEPSLAVAPLGPPYAGARHRGTVSSGAKACAGRKCRKIRAPCAPLATLVVLATLLASGSAQQVYRHNRTPFDAVNLTTAQRRKIGAIDERFKPRLMRLHKQELAGQDIIDRRDNLNREYSKTLLAIMSPAPKNGLSRSGVPTRSRLPRYPPGQDLRRDLRVGRRLREEA